MPLQGQEVELKTHTNQPTGILGKVMGVNNQGALLLQTKEWCRNFPWWGVVTEDSSRKTRPKKTRTRKAVKMKILEIDAGNTRIKWRLLE